MIPALRNIASVNCDTIDSIHCLDHSILHSFRALYNQQHHVALLCYEVVSLDAQTASKCTKISFIHNCLIKETYQSITIHFDELSGTNNSLMSLELNATHLVFWRSSQDRRRENIVNIWTPDVTLILRSTSRSVHFHVQQYIVQTVPQSHSKVGHRS